MPRAMSNLALFLLAMPYCAALVPTLASTVRATGRNCRWLLPPACLSTETSSPILSRRCVSLLSPMLLFAPLAAHADDDPLVTDPLVAALQDVRAQFGSGIGSPAVALVQNREWDEVRTLVRKALTPLTMKGYLGASVKSRIVALAEGSPERQSLNNARQDLLQALGALDKLAFEQQKLSPLSGAAQVFDPTEALSYLQASVDAMDAVIKRLAA